MDQDRLTTHSGKTLLAFNQTRVPGLGSGTNWSDSTRPLRSYWVDLQYNFEFYPTRPSGFFIMSADTESIRIDVAGTVLSPARKFGGSYLCTMRATSEVFAMDEIRECFEYDFVCELSRALRRLTLCRYSIGCATALPMGVAPEIVLYCLQWRIISDFITMHMLIEDIFCRNSIGCTTVLPMGVAPGIMMYYL